MIKLFTQNELDKAKPLELLPLECLRCKTTFFKTKKYIIAAMSRPRRQGKRQAVYCSRACAFKAKETKVSLKCNQCGQQFTKLPNQMKKSKSGNHFCSKTCAATYNNLHKTTGTRRSKLEAWLENELKKQHPDLHFMFNDKSAINSELDIYIPSLKLAFELNGIYHYEPIHGHEKLAQIQSNDHRKFQACLENNIELCIIDSSQLKYFKPKNAQKYLDIICSIINKKG